ncbi:MAG: Ku protein [Betaproteobacteria bacterium]
MPRELWKGAIHFGLVNVPVSLYPAEQREELSFTMLDRRDMSPVGYKRFNKNTGDEVPYEQIVKGYEWEDGQYVTLEKEDFKRANVEASQTVDIIGFVDAAEIPLYYFESPYYLAPGKHGEKGYALLRETLERTGRVGIANVVIRTRQHLAALYPQGKLLVLNTLRYQNEIRSAEDLKVPADLKDAKVQPREMQMAERLVQDMVMKWDPGEYHDTYRDDLLKLIEEKAEGRLERAPKPRKQKEAEVIDFASLLEKSLAARRKGAGEEAGEEGTHRRKPAARTKRKAAPRSSHAHNRRAA